MILDPTIKLEAVLAGAITTSQPEVHIEYVVWNNDTVQAKPTTFRTALNSNTDVTILAAPIQQGFALEVINLAIYNKDTVSATVTVKTDDGTTERIILKRTLQTLETLHWTKSEGWYVIPSGSSAIVGTTTNDSATVGYVGEFIQTLVASGAPITLSNNTAANVASVSLTAGDWDVEGNINFTGTTATITGGQGGISSTSATLPTDGSEVYDGTITTLLSDTSSVTLPCKRVSIAVTTSVYLVAKKSFSAGTVVAFGQINARRVR